MLFDLHNRYPSVEFCFNNKSVIIRYWGGLKFDKVVLNGEINKKNEAFKQRVIEVVLNNSEIIMDVDGYYYYLPNTKSIGSMNSHELRIIADYLDEINKPLEDQLEKDFKSSKHYLE